MKTDDEEHHPGFTVFLIQVFSEERTPFLFSSTVNREL